LGPGTWTLVSKDFMKTDVELQRNVTDELSWEPSVNAAHVGATVMDGVVTLSGSVPSYAERVGAELACRRIHGVQAVANELEVNLPDDSLRTDADIQAEATGALRSDLSVPPDAVRVVVRNGWVILEGDVAWAYQRDKAENAMRSLTGVLGVRNLVSVTAAVSPAEVKSHIDAALERSGAVDARGVHVEVRGGEILLRGHVSSWAEKEAIERAAWTAPGIYGVEDQITVARQV
jgi:osmotically-inducible protein OsmY